jgi:hypothetical protein
MAQFGSGVDRLKRSKIFYFSHRHNAPTGGQKHTYRHVDILSQNGYQAFVFHPGDEFRLTWFQNETPVITESAFYNMISPHTDFVVLPEDLGLRINLYPGRKVIFNKNLFLGFRSLGLADPPLYPYDAPDVVAAFTVSEHNRSHLQFAFPHLFVERVYLEVDTNVFRFCPLPEKRPQIAFVVKHVDGLLSCYHMINARAKAGLNRGNRFDWTCVQGKSERETATILHESLIFLFLSLSEGLGRMPLEAMASGCLLASYECGPLYETIPRYAMHPPGDVVSLVTHLENIMNSYNDSANIWDQRVRLGLDVAKAYSPERQRRTLLGSWNRLLAKLDN